MEFSASIEDPTSLKQWVKCLQYITRLGRDDIGFVINSEEVRLAPTRGSTTLLFHTFFIISNISSSC